MNVQFKKWKCIAVGSAYLTNNMKAISLIDAEDGEPIATATVNIVEVEDLPDDEVFIKDYSENMGMVKALIDADIIDPQVILSVNNGHVKIQSFKLTEKALKTLWKDEYN